MLAKGMQKSLVERSVSVLQEEFLELETAFLLMVMGPLAGLKTTTLLFSLELMDALSEEIKVLETRAVRGKDVMSDLIDVLMAER
ncbi:MAG: hypothetical protein QXW94_02270 [Desulfurococcaceae archaeon]